MTRPKLTRSPPTANPNYDDRIGLVELYGLSEQLGTDRNAPDQPIGNR
ncbi:hypothetical protein [Isosphaera pallida]|nr:hypothetical protein [Isosphaera pallida]